MKQDKKPLQESMEDTIREEIELKESLKTKPEGIKQEQNRYSLPGDDEQQEPIEVEEDFDDLSDEYSDEKFEEEKGLTMKEDIEDETLESQST